MSIDLKGRKVVHVRPLFSCEEMCERGRNGPGNDAARAASRCSLPDFDPGRWDPAADQEAAEIAESRARELVEVAAAQGLTLDFELDRDGCPAGYIHCGYVRSVQGFMGSRVGQSNWVPSLRLTRRMLRDEVEPTRLLETVAHAEAHEDVARQIVEAAGRE